MADNDKDFVDNEATVADLLARAKRQHATVEDRSIGKGIVQMI
jgi:hypothetical protein